MTAAHLTDFGPDDPRSHPLFSRQPSARHAKNNLSDPPIRFDFFGA